MTRTTIARIAAGVFAILPLLGSLGAAEGQGEPDYYTWGLTACLRNGSPRCTYEEPHITVTNSDSVNSYLIHVKAEARLCANRASTPYPSMCQPVGKHTEFGPAEALDCDVARSPAFGLCYSPCPMPCGNCIQTKENPPEFSCGCDCSIESAFILGPQTSDDISCEQCNRGQDGCSNSCENVACDQTSFCLELVDVTLELKGVCSDNCPEMTAFDPPVLINICGAPQRYDERVPCAQETCCTPGSIPD